MGRSRQHHATADRSRSRLAHWAVAARASLSWPPRRSAPTSPRSTASRQDPQARRRRALVPHLVKELCIKRRRYALPWVRGTVWPGPCPTWSALGSTTQQLLIDEGGTKGAVMTVPHNRPRPGQRPQNTPAGGSTSLVVPHPEAPQGHSRPWRRRWELRPVSDVEGLRRGLGVVLVLRVVDLHKALSCGMHRLRQPTQHIAGLMKTEFGKLRRLIDL
jgi:hypothetical protein